MDLLRAHLIIMLFFGISFLFYQMQFASAQEYYAFNYIPDDINATFGDVILAFESDLNENFGATLSILNSIAIIVMAIILKIKLSNKVIVSKPSK